MVAEVLTTVQVCDATGDDNSTKGDIQKIGRERKIIIKKKVDYGIFVPCITTVLNIVTSHTYNTQSCRAGKRTAQS